MILHTISYNQTHQVPKQKDAIAAIGAKAVSFFIIDPAKINSDLAPIDEAVPISHPQEMVFSCKMGISPRPSKCKLCDQLSSHIRIFTYTTKLACVRDDLVVTSIPVECFCIFEGEDPLHWVSPYPKLLRAQALLIAR